MALNGKSNEERIWNYLKSKGLNDYGCAGLLGNIFAESGLNPKNLENTYERKLGYSDEEYCVAVDNGSYPNFIKDCAGWGICQWTYYTRKQALYEYAKSKNKSIGDLEMQLEFLYKELSESYQSVLKVLKNATSILEASNAVLLKFERPYDQSISAQNKRASYGQNYYNKYAVKGDGIVSEFKMRTTKPEAGNKYYITKSKGGWSNAIPGSPTDVDCNVLSNCVGYAYGRFNEIGGYGCCKYLQPVNAENFIQYKGNLTVGQTPKIGACMVWQRGNTLSNSDGAGHVAIVEKVVSDTEIITSESGWNSKPFWNQTRKKGNGNWGQGSACKFLGFIYNPAVSNSVTVATKPIQTITPPTITTSSDDIYVVKSGDTLASIAAKYGTTYQKLAKYNNIVNPDSIRTGQRIKIPCADVYYTVGRVYKTQVDQLSIRSGAGTNYARKTYNQLSANAKQHAHSSGRLKNGVEVTCLETKKVGSNIWMRIPSGWCAAYYDGQYYIK
jgi:LysM repeat protein